MFSFSNILRNIILIYLMLILPFIAVSTYFVFVGIAMATFNLFIYYFNLLLTQSPMFLLFAIFIVISDFGGLFILGLLLFHIVRSLPSFFINGFKFLYSLFDLQLFDALKSIHNNDEMLFGLLIRSLSLPASLFIKNSFASSCFNLEMFYIPYILLFQSSNIFQDLRGMFDPSAEFSPIIRNSLLYKIILCIIILLLQLSFLIYAKTNSFADTIMLVLCRLFLIYYNLAFNIFDLIINFKDRFLNLKEKIIKIVFCVTMVLYIVLIIAITIFDVYLMTNNIIKDNEKIIYVEDHDKWNRIEGIKINRDGFCFLKAREDDTLNIDDFSMLTTLPRLYDVNKDNKCYIKEEKKNMFNVTMKYIFGSDFNEQGIYILCRKLINQKVLVISSEKMLYKSLKKFKNITILNKQFNATGFDRYQINFETDLIIQPSFITSKGKLIGATHYIVGGSYENTNDIKLFAETFLKEYQSKFINSILAGYYPIRSIFQFSLCPLQAENKKLLNPIDQSSKEIEQLLKMYSQFNFSKESLFSIGHSITGTFFKVASYKLNTTGVAFESAETDSNLLNGSEFSSLLIPFSNIFSNKFYSIGIDKNCMTNGALPKKYIFPNVYETACQVAISCSETRKYVPFCKQMLSPNEKISENEFNKSFDAFLKHYHFNE